MRASKGLAALVIGHARHTSCSRLVCGVAAAAAARISCSAIITIVSYIIIIIYTVVVCLPEAASAAVAVEDEWLGRAACGVFGCVGGVVCAP